MNPHGISVWLDAADRLNVSVGGHRFYSYPGWGHVLCYGFLIGIACLAAAAFYAAIKHLASAMPLAKE